MVDPHFTEDEQTERIKEWWKQNGSSIIFGAVLGIGIIFGYNYWKEYKRSQAETASALYEQMMIDYSEKHVGSAEAAGAKLMEGFEGTPYAGNAALFLAKISFEKDDLTSAKQQLQWVIDHVSDPSTVHAARIRMARVLLATGDTKRAKALITLDDFGGFTSQYQELMGDLALTLGDAARAKQAYQRALDSLPTGVDFTEMLNLKLDHATAEEQRQ